MPAFFIRAAAFCIGLCLFIEAGYGVIGGAPDWLSALVYGISILLMFSSLLSRNDQFRRNGPGLWVVGDGVIQR